VTKSKKSISNFKLRENLEIGCKVTMRGERMYNFLYVFINLVLPKIRDFRGIPVNSFDGQGNYSMGLKDQIIFPGINFDQVESLRGMDVTFVTSAKNNEECRALLEYFGMPFRKN
jgi:large subunit ribosomal protein L5